LRGRDLRLSTGELLRRRLAQSLLSWRAHEALRRRGLRAELWLKPHEALRRRLERIALAVLERRQNWSWRRAKAFLEFAGWLTLWRSS
jgi:hypothetical protein